MTEPKWLLRSVIDAMHDMQLAEHGGLAGLRDEAMLESALSRPQTLLHYGDPDLYDLAAAYAFGLARNHPYVDGNKRTAFLAAYVFLKINGVALATTEVEATQKMLALAAGSLQEDQFAQWLGDNCQTS